ncbi:hypothetical protein [Streptomyces sp. NBC_00620]|uniref:hypothetical protein n=1 Tax=Streptomyces sp. NBC_00620 TaxID=2903666 RepID=UPI002256039C|nr:hypothetical protein [Streptomyces sp. NBC_00620]MCX4974191.1 hypothetical protein [Streptomyces sp. NBC_00620]
MRRSTITTRVLGGSALACVAVALSLVFVRYDAPAPRTDILAALGLAAVAAAGWAFACRTAPALGPAPEAASSSALPGRLPLPRWDLGTVIGFLLLALTPYSAHRLAQGPGGGGVFLGLVGLLLIVVTVKAMLFARKQTSMKQRLLKLKVLAEDAAHGEVYAVRVQAGEPVRMRLSERGDKPGAVDVSYWHWIVLREGAHEIRLAAPREDVARAAVRFGGQEGWLYLPKRWKLIDDELPTAFVADGGEALLGLTDPDEVRAYLVKDLRTTSSDRSARRVPSTAKFRMPVHLSTFGGALLATLLALPVLLLGNDLPTAAAWFLCALAAGSAVTGALRGAGDGATRAVMSDVKWTERDETDPSIA